MNCIQKQQLVSFPKVRIWKPWFRHFNNHKEFRNEGTVHLFSLMALFSYANFRSNERMISGARYMEAPGQWICKLGSLPRILRVHSKRQALEQLDYYEKYGFLTYEWLDKENEIIRFSIINWKEHCTSLQYNYYSYKGSGFFFFPLPVGRMLLRVAHKTEGIVFSELDAIMDMWLHTILNDPKVRGSEYMPVVYYSNMRGVPLLSYTYLAKRWGWSKSRVGRFMLKAGEYGIISRVSFSSSRGSVISMCRYREMIFGDTCEELELSSIGEIIGITKATTSTDTDEGKMEIIWATRPPKQAERIHLPKTLSRRLLSRREMSSHLMAAPQPLRLPHRQVLQDQTGTQPYRPHPPQMEALTFPTHRLNFVMLKLAVAELRVMRFPLTGKPNENSPCIAQSSI